MERIFLLAPREHTAMLGTESCGKGWQAVSRGHVSLDTCSRTQGPQSYRHREVNSTNNWGGWGRAGCLWRLLRDLISQSAGRSEPSLPRD